MFGCSWDCCGLGPPKVYINYQFRDDFYDYYKSKGYLKYKYSVYNRTHGYHSRSSMSRAYRYGHDVLSCVKVRDRYSHHARRNKIRSALAHKFSGLEDIPYLNRYY